MKTLLLLLVLSPSVAVAEPAFWTWPPARPQVNASELADLQAHCTRPGVYADPTYSTYCHELTHGIASDIRQTIGAGFNGFYVLGNRCLVLGEPHCTLADVAARCKWRGPTFSLYMLSQQRGHGNYVGWNSQPLYIVDEFIAYTHGLMAGGGQSDYMHAREFSYYAHTLVATIEELDPAYRDLESLKEFISWNDDRIDSYGERQ